MKMTAKDLDEKIRAVAPQWMINEADSLIEIGKAEGWEDPPSNIMECWDWWSGQDWTDTRKFRLAMTKIERAIGMQRQLGRGETCQSTNSRGCRNYHEGDWIFDKCWDELVR